MGPSKRGFAGSLTQVYFSIGYMSASLLAYLLPNWRGYTLAVAGLTGAGLLTAPFFPKSPRFLYARNKYSEGRKILNTFGDKTGSVLDTEYLNQFERQLQSPTVSANIENKKFTVIDLFRSQQMTLITVNLSVAFMKWEYILYDKIYENVKKKHSKFCIFFHKSHVPERPKIDQKDPELTKKKDQKRPKTRV